MGTRMTANGILKNFLNEGDLELPETNLLQLDEQVRKKYFISLMPGFCLSSSWSEPLEAFPAGQGLVNEKGNDSDRIWDIFSGFSCRHWGKPHLHIQSPVSGPPEYERGVPQYQCRHCLLLLLPRGCWNVSAAKCRRSEHKKTGIRGGTLFLKQVSLIISSTWSVGLLWREQMYVHSRAVRSQQLTRLAGVTNTVVAKPGSSELARV